MAAVDADLWVLTETREAITPPEGYHPLHCPPLDSHALDERMVSIWSRWPIVPTDLTPRARGMVSGIVQTPEGPLAVVGSVIPYAHDKGAEGTSRLWQEHYREIKRLGPEWAALAADMPVVVAGDLNQDRDGSRVLRDPPGPGRAHGCARGGGPALPHRAGRRRHRAAARPPPDRPRLRLALPRGSVGGQLLGTRRR